MEIHRYGDQPQQFIRYHGRPEGNLERADVELVLIHGGYWRSRYTLDLMDPMAVHLNRRGWTVANLEYRRIGDTPDPWSAMSADMESALTRGPSRKRILIGHSAGGHLALWAAAQPWSVDHITAAVALAPVSDLVMADERQLSNHATAELLGQDPEIRQARLAAASPRHRLPIGVPTYVIHGDADDSVPPEMSVGFVADALAAGDRAEFDNPSGVDHMEIIDPTSDIWPTIESAIRRLAG